MYYQAAPWHRGESLMRTMMRAPDVDNPTIPALSVQLSRHLRSAPLLSVGILDDSGRPWTTLLGSGEGSIAQTVAENVVGISALVNVHDPVVSVLTGEIEKNTLVWEEPPGRMISGVTIDLKCRTRVKMSGRVVAKAINGTEQECMKQLQLIVKVEQSLGNCPKYLNQKHIRPVTPSPQLNPAPLTQRAAAWIQKLDMFFISSSNSDQDMDTNYRGGPPGFLRVETGISSSFTVYWPEYSGNRLYQTLGNLLITPYAGLCLPDFGSGDVLYLTGRTRVLTGDEATAVLPRSNLVVALTVLDARFVSNALPFRGTPGLLSPYTPQVRYLASETPDWKQPPVARGTQAVLLSQTEISPSISRFKFALEGGMSCRAGQHVVLDFAAHLHHGYSHMRDDEPQSLNDDFIRAFTVTSPAHARTVQAGLGARTQFDITVRRVGVATSWLFKRQASDARFQTDILVRGFAGDFRVEQRNATECIAFIAAGIGITPLLPFLAGDLDLPRLRVLWSIRRADLGLVEDLVKTYEEAKMRLVLFITDNSEDEGPQLSIPWLHSIEVHLRRMRKADVCSLKDVSRLYVCTARPMRDEVAEWCPDKQLVTEAFDY